jgi:hypothetical protein
MKVFGQFTPLSGVLAAGNHILSRTAGSVNVQSRVQYQHFLRCSSHSKTHLRLFPCLEKHTSVLPGPFSHAFRPQSAFTVAFCPGKDLPKFPRLASDTPSEQHVSS